MNTPVKEWDFEAPWGKISLTSWGNPDALPVFMAHGRQDCSATFQPLLQLLPGDEHHYVAIDLPGSGGSTPLPVGNNNEEMANNEPNDVLTPTSAQIQEVPEITDESSVKVTVNKNMNHQVFDQAVPCVSPNANYNGLLTTAFTHNLINQEQVSSANAGRNELLIKAPAQNMMNQEQLTLNNAGGNQLLIIDHMQNILNQEHVASTKTGKNGLLTTVPVQNRINEKHLVSTCAVDNGLLTTASAQNLMYQEQAAQAAANEINPVDIALKIDNIVLEIEDPNVNTVIRSEVADDEYTIFEVDPNGNFPSCINSNVNVAYDEDITSLILNYDLSDDEGEPYKNQGDNNDKEEILDINNKHLLKADDIIVHEETGYSFRILWSEPMQSFCVKIFSNAEIDVRRQKYRIVKNSSIRFISLNDNDTLSQEVQVQSNFDATSIVSSNSPQESGNTHLKAKFDTVTVDVNVASTMFDKLSLSPSTPEISLDTEVEKIVFPKSIKCNDHGVDGKCPFAIPQSAFYTPPKRCDNPFYNKDTAGTKAKWSCNVATPIYSSPALLVTSDDLYDAVDIGAARPDMPTDDAFLAIMETNEDIAHINCANNSESQDIDSVITTEWSEKIVKFEAQSRSPKSGRSSLKKCKRHKDKGTACLCVCLPLNGRGPLAWIADRIQRCLKRKNSQRSSRANHKRHFGNRYMNTRYCYKNEKEYPILFIPPLPMQSQMGSYRLHRIPDSIPLNVYTESYEDATNEATIRPGVNDNGVIWPENGQYYEVYLPTCHTNPLLTRRVPASYNANLGQYGPPIGRSSTSSAPPNGMGLYMRPYPINPRITQPTPRGRGRNPLHEPPFRFERQPERPRGPKSNGFRRPQY